MASLGGVGVMPMTHEAIAIPQRRRRPAVAAFYTALRLILPVTALIAALAAANWGLPIPLRELDPFFPAEPAALRPGQWLTLGHALLALTFLAVSLVGRRYGAPIAVGQVLATAIIAAAVVVAAAVAPIPALSAIPVPPLRMGAAFGGALVLGLLFSALIFDWTRGVVWWTAPLYSALWGSIVFCVTFYPAAYAGIGGPWITHAIVHLGVLVAGAFALLIPYWILRPVIRPLSGFGGY